LARLAASCLSETMKFPPVVVGTVSFVLPTRGNTQKDRQWHRWTGSDWKRDDDIGRKAVN
jgi:hypothetical protein